MLRSPRTLDRVMSDRSRCSIECYVPYITSSSSCHIISAGTLSSSRAKIHPTSYHMISDTSPNGNNLSDVRSIFRVVELSSNATTICFGPMESHIDRSLMYGAPSATSNDRHATRDMWRATTCLRRPTRDVCLCFVPIQRVVAPSYIPDGTPFLVGCA